MYIAPIETYVTMESVLPDGPGQSPPKKIIYAVKMTLLVNRAQAYISAEIVSSIMGN